MNSNGTNIWLLDNAILLPSNMTVILDNCTLQLSDKCRDNMFRSDNVGLGITHPEWNRHINIIGIGDVYLKGADNPRATGDGARTLVSSPKDTSHGWRVSYGSDAGKKGVKQKGDWRNIMILMAYVNGFKLKNVNIVNAHAWAVSFERTHNAEICDITFNCPEDMTVNGTQVKIHNRDGINLRQGCKKFYINNISGITEDDFIALSNLTVEDNPGGNLDSTMITSTLYQGEEDDIEDVVITNIKCVNAGVGIRTSGNAGIHNVLINGLTTLAHLSHHQKNYNRRIYTLLIGGKGYGKPSLPGRINNVHCMNIIGNGNPLVLIQSPIADCSVVNGTYYNEKGGEIVSYVVAKDRIANLTLANLRAAAKNNSD